LILLAWNLVIPMTSMAALIALAWKASDEEIRVLCRELCSVVQGEDRSPKAVDDLSITLSDITMKARQVKLWLSEMQAKLEATPRPM
jgi:hypothetical protein